MARDWTVSIVWRDAEGTHCSTVTVCATTADSAEAFVRAAYSQPGTNVISVEAREMAR